MDSVISADTIVHRVGVMFVSIPMSASRSIGAALNYYCPHTKHIIAHHFPADAWKRAYGAQYDMSRAFAVIRSPWERAVAFWFHFKNALGPLTFAQWVAGGCNTGWKIGDASHLREPWLSLSIDWTHHDPVSARDYLCDWDTGELLVAHLICMDNLQEEFNALMDELSVVHGHLDNLGKRDYGDYRQHYTDSQTVDIIAERYAWEIERFGFQYGG